MGAAIWVFLILFALLTGLLYPLAIMGIAQVFFPGKATGGVPYQAAASPGSNLGPTSALLYDQVAERAALLRAVATDANAPIPVDLVTASASGLDPHISPAAASYQISRLDQLSHP